MKYALLFLSATILTMFWVCNGQVKYKATIRQITETEYRGNIWRQMKEMYPEDSLTAEDSVNFFTSKVPFKLSKYKQQKKDTLKVYYYMWSAIHGGNSGGGENVVEQNHKPTTKEVKSYIISFMGNDYWGIRYLRVDEIVEFKNMDDYYKWHSGQNFGMKLYEKYLNQQK